MTPLPVSTFYTTFIFGAFASESGAHSDRLGHFWGFCVRIRGSFGQIGAFFRPLCPNQWLIRTAWGIFWAFVSESGAHSDSLRPFLGFCVRIRGSFGQIKAFFGLLCPNQGLIRTDWGIFGAFVSESRAYSDKLGIFWAFVSESGAHSDRLGHFWGFRVRIRGSFGQLKNPLSLLYYFTS
jgi:hypothetical protein